MTILKSPKASLNRQIQQYIKKRRNIIIIFSHRVSLTQQAFLITPLHNSHSMTGKMIMPKKWYFIICIIIASSTSEKDRYFIQFCCNTQKISVSVLSAIGGQIESLWIQVLPPSDLYSPGPA